MANDLMVTALPTDIGDPWIALPSWLRNSIVKVADRGIEYGSDGQFSAAHYFLPRGKTVKLAVDPDVMRQQLTLIEERLVAGQPEKLIALVTANLATAFVPDVGDMSGTGATILWLEDIGEYPIWAVSEAFKDHRRENPEKRPAPGRIRDRCQKLVGNLRLAGVVLRDNLARQAA